MILRALDVYLNRFFGQIFGVFFSHLTALPKKSVVFGPFINVLGLGICNFVISN